MIKKTKNKRYDQFLMTNHDDPTESLTNLANTVKEPEQSENENGASTRTNIDDGEQLGNNASAETNSTQHSGVNKHNIPISVQNKLSDDNTETISSDFLMTKEGNIYKACMEIVSEHQRWWY